MPKIFISYRREDAQHQADRIHAALKKAVRDPKRDIFIDIDNIPAGVDFVQHLDGKVAECDVLLALIGPDWLQAKNPKTGARRLDDPKDFVRIEIGSALKRGVQVAPVLLDGAGMPGEDDLPDELKPLARRNAVEVRRATFDEDAARMVRKLELREAGKAKATTARAAQARRSGGMGWIAPVIALILLAGAGAGGWLWFADPLGWKGAPTAESNPAPSGPAPSVSAQSASPPPPASLREDPAGAVGGSPPPPKAGEVSTLAKPATTEGAARSADTPASAAPPKLRVVLERTLSGHSGDVRSAAFSPDGSRIVTASFDNTARIWDAATGKALATLSGHSAWVESAAFSPDGSRIVTASRDNTARIWDAATGKALATLSGQSSWVTSAAFSPDGSRIVTASGDNTARVWDSGSATILLILSLPGGTVLGSAAFSPDGSSIVTTPGDNTARIWNAATGKTLATLSGNSYVVYSAAFSPDGSRIVTASGDETAHIWDAATGKVLATLSKHSNDVLSAAFSPDGSRIVTASRDNTACIWDAHTGARLAILSGHSASVNSAAFSPDGSRIVTASQDKTARIWRIEPN